MPASAQQQQQQQQPPKTGADGRYLMFAFDMATSGHMCPGLWTHKDDKSVHYNKIQYWTDLAKLLEKGKFDGIFQADVLGGYDVYNGNLEGALTSGAQFPLIDPTLTVAAMAAVTQHLTFGVTATTSYEPPYTLARKFSTLDHLTSGRVGWNVVTGYLDSAARQFGNVRQDLHAKRYDVAHEYMDVVYKLWESSWADDAVKLDAAKGLFTDPTRVKTINHKGQYYPSVPGPHICEPSMQRTPVIFQAGSSGPGMDFAAKHAEVIFIAANTPELAKKRVDAVREGAVKAGRDPSTIKVLALLLVVTAATNEEAQKKHDDWISHGSDEGALALFGGWTGMDLGPYKDDEELRAIESNAIKSAMETFAAQGPKVPKWTKKVMAQQIKLGGLGPVLVGGPESIADQLDSWVRASGIDGFNLAYGITPGTALDLVEHVVPVLQARGRMQKEYPQRTQPAALLNRKPTGTPGFGEGDAGVGLTAREILYGEGQNALRDDHYGRRFRWEAGKDQPDLDAISPPKKPLEPEAGSEKKD